MSGKGLREKTISVNLLNLDELQAYFEEKALEGWEVKEISRGCKFEKTEPKKIKYAVVYFKYSHKTDEEEAEFIKSCEEQGWKYIDHNNSIYVFKGVTDCPTPIEADKKRMRREIIHKYIFQNLLMWLLVPIFAILSMNLMSEWVLINYFFLVLFIIALYPLVIILMDLINFIRWCIRTSERFSRAGKKPNLERFSMLKSVSWLVLCVMLIICFAYGRYEPSALVSRDTLPITLEKVSVYPSEGSKRETTYKKSSTFLATEEVYKDYFEIENEAADKGVVKYSIFKSDSPFLMDFYVYTHTHRLFIECKKGDSEEWGAKAVYLVSSFERETIVVYDDIVFIYKNALNSKIPDSEDIASIRKALGH